MQAGCRNEGIKEQMRQSWACLQYGNVLEINLSFGGAWKSQGLVHQGSGSERRNMGDYLSFLDMGSMMSLTARPLVNQQYFLGFMFKTTHPESLQKSFSMSEPNFTFVE